jgi:hypothetical protein
VCVCVCVCVRERERERGYIYMHNTYNIHTYIRTYIQIDICIYISMTKGCCAGISDTEMHILSVLHLTK